ncbi:MAG: hypothetical protein KJ941_10275 [Bacteroidetes bacterium]|nr:hypothetical protein [Bacteroidota bacterium]
MNIIPFKKEILETETGIHWWDENQIFITETKNVPRNYDSVKKSIAFVSKQFEGKKYCGIIESTNLQPLDKKSRVLLSDEVKKLYKAIAIVSKSPMHRVLGNIVFAISSNEIPRKAFANVDDAKIWLAQYH